MWYLFFSCLGWIVIQVYMDADVEYTQALKDDKWTFHPLYSIYKFSTANIHTVRSRITLVFVSVGAMSWFNALMVNRFIEKPDREDQNLGLVLTVFPLFSIFFSWFIDIFIGWFLYVYY